MVRQRQAEAEAEPKPHPKPKPQPQAQPPPPPLLPPHPLAAKKSAKAVKVVEEEDEEEDELESMRGELQRLSSSLGAQRAARARAETKVAGWEAKVAELRAAGEGEREGWAASNLEKARAKVREEEDNIQRLERSIRWMEECVAKEAKVKEELEEEVVEVGVEEAVEGKVVQERYRGAGQWVRGKGSDGRGHPGPASPHPSNLNLSNLDHPLLVLPESPIWTLCFLMPRAHHKILGQGRWVWADEGGIHQDKPLRVGGGGGCRGLVVATGRGEKRPPLPTRG